MKEFKIFASDGRPAGNVQGHEILIIDGNICIVIRRIGPKPLIVGVIPQGHSVFQADIVKK